MGLGCLSCLNSERESRTLFFSLSSPPTPAVHDGLAGVDPAHLIAYTPSLLSVSLSREVHKGAGGGKRGIYGMRSGGDNMRVASRLRDQMPKPTWMPVHTGLGLRTGTGR